MANTSSKMMTIILILVIGIIQGCYTTFTPAPNPKGPSPEKIEEKYLSYIKKNDISEKEIIKRLGKPSYNFYEDDICIYRLVLGDEKIINLGENYMSTYPSMGKQYYRYSLVLLFDNNRKLKDKAIIPER